MARLSTFPWDVLKIDRTFITPLGRTDNAELVVSGIISLAHSLGMRTAAEGVETVEQLQQLRDLGCDIVQGFIIDHPLPAAEALQRMTGFSTGDQGCDVIGWTAPSAALISDVATCSTARPGSEPPRAGTPAPGDFAPSTG